MRRRCRLAAQGRLGGDGDGAREDAECLGVGVSEDVRAGEGHRVGVDDGVAEGGVEGVAEAQREGLVAAAGQLDPGQLRAAEVVELEKSIAKYVSDIRN